MRSRARRLFLDTAPLRLDRDYRWLWSGPGRLGHRQPDHPGRPAVPGLRADRVDAGDRRADAVPAGADPPVRAGAGSLADAVDRRRLLMVTQVGLAACSADPGPPGAQRRSAACRRCSRSRSSRPGLAPSTSRPARRRSRGSSRPSGCRRRSPSTSSTSRPPRSSGRPSAGSSSRRSGWRAPTRSTCVTFLASLDGPRGDPPAATAARRRPAGARGDRGGTALCPAAAGDPGQLRRSTSTR